MIRLVALFAAMSVAVSLAACSGGPSLPDPLGLFSGGSSDPVAPRDSSPYIPPEAPEYTPGGSSPSYTPPSGYDSGYGYTDPGYTDPGSYPSPTYPDPGYPSPSYPDSSGGYPAPAPDSGGAACGAGGRACS